MKVIQVTPRYAPHTGGVEMQVQALSERLARRGHEVTVLTADAGPDVQRSTKQNGVTVRRQRALAPGGAFHLAPGISRAVAKEKADIVHAHNVHSFPLALGALGRRDALFVATTYYHGASANGFRNLLWSAYRPLIGRLLRRADVITAVSDWERRQLSKDFGVPAETVPIGIDKATFTDAMPLDRDHPYLLCVNRLEKYKGVQYAIEALSGLEGYDLLVVGEGPYRDELERIARDSGLGDRVEFLGEVDHSELPAFYAGASVYLLLSTFESYGITVGEALASGTPCVVRNIRALGEWSTLEGCIAVEDTTSITIQSAVERAEQTTVDAHGIPSWDEVIDRFVEIYESR